MGKITNPVLFSTAFKVDEKELVSLGILNPTLNLDTRLFIDPLLLKGSGHPEMKEASNTYNAHFITVIKLLQGTKVEGDTAARNAFRLLSFPEIKWTCLGYGVTSVSGGGSGPKTTKQVYTTAKEIVHLGVDDPDLFVAMALFEDNFGPDRIGDMATNVIFRDLLTFNARILEKLKVPLKEFHLVLESGAAYDAALPQNVPAGCKGLGQESRMRHPRMPNYAVQ